jgi:hypothetical protein
VKLLEIQSSPRGESSDSITLTKSDSTSIVVDMLNVWHERLSDVASISLLFRAGITLVPIGIGLRRRFRSMLVPNDVSSW